MTILITLLLIAISFLLVFVSTLGVHRCWAMSNRRIALALSLFLAFSLTAIALPGLAADYILTDEIDGPQGGMIGISCFKDAYDAEEPVSYEAIDDAYLARYYLAVSNAMDRHGYASSLFSNCWKKNHADLTDYIQKNANKSVCYPIFREYLANCCLDEDYARLENEQLNLVALDINRLRFEFGKETQKAGLECISVNYLHVIFCVFAIFVLLCNIIAYRDIKLVALSIRWKVSA